MIIYLKITNRKLIKTTLNNNIRNMNTQNGTLKDYLIKIEQKNRIKDTDKKYFDALREMGIIVFNGDVEQ